jgi:heme exporter protein CcmD
MQQSLVMGGYAGYLLVAYGVTTVVVIANIVAARRRFRSTRQRLMEQLRRRATKVGRES